ncbi:perforin-like protein 2 [Plasmodium knowlesi strain H]|uniref:Perforin-like protein 2 n=3 Tax=Plasmodium knowlesi TaxID=5850 RepID=A0A5K1U887_PLAKH|nr:perforin-like protein 2 [Plasmodium knowlesi strain H]OTN64029.1 putative MAC/Perforin domain [Plasmodium knowlesi]CAA9990960.1 perforin-like protein 2 [Plasmodium knowlesi strain H]SBO20811.1 perforin-like protein 2 [Plasmodium knowlesi strain H]SBO21239.1 perforin-like protein 2 [Plasmodium knowlesi strain H]VVS80434.1 perforin-like protein 2 [Plasmodium knowlesi strain H]|eukprot:XP_002262243.1 MAC/Perforin domain, putative [Plasmodium knowlesi strain H]
MRTTVERVLAHLLLVYLSAHNVKCEISRYFLMHEKYDDFNLEKFNSSDFLNEEKSYIADVNSVGKRKRLQNDNGIFAGNPLYGCFNKYALRRNGQYGQNVVNKDRSAKLNVKNEPAKCNGDTCSSFMLIKAHLPARHTVKKNEKNHTLCNLQREGRNCKKIPIGEEKMEQAVTINKHNYNSNLVDLTRELNKQHMPHGFPEGYSKEKKKNVHTEPSDIQSFTHSERDTASPSNMKKNPKREEKQIRIHGNSKQNELPPNERSKNGRDNMVMLPPYNDSIGYSGGNYFEKEKFINIKFPIKISREVAEQNQEMDNEKQIMKKLHKHQAPRNNSDANFAEFTNKEGEADNTENRNKNIVNSKLGEGNLIGIFKTPYILGRDSFFIKNEMEDLKQINSERGNKQYKDFDLRDTLMGETGSITNTQPLGGGTQIMKNKNNVLTHNHNPNYGENHATYDKVHNPDIDLSLKYLGLGYDIIMGNPEGDPTINVDPGFRGPVLQINIEEMRVNKDISGDLNGTTSLYGSDIRGGGLPYRESTLMGDYTIEEHKTKLTPWVIPEHSCSQSKNVEEIQNLEQYKMELLSDVKVSTPSIFPYSFSASAEYKNAIKKLKVQNNVIFMMKIYCLRYYTGIPTTTSWRFTDNFRNALKKLPRTFDGLKEDSQCSYEYYINKIHTPECEENVNKWMMFFRLHGTHVAHEIYLGGKIIIKMNMEKDEYNKLKDNNISIKTFFNLYFHKMGLSGGYSKHTQKLVKKFRTSEDISILGGNPGLNIENSTFFEKWVNSINKNSMPIRTKLLPFSFFMDDPYMIQAYKDALTFYGLTYGVQIFDHEKYSHVVLSIGEYLEKCTQKLYAGPPPGLLTCPLGSSLLMGFSLNLDFYKNKDLSSTNGMASCEQMKESCSGNGFGKKYSDIRIWGLCSEKPLDFITQVVQQGESPKITASCPGNLVILFGFALMKGKGSSSANKVDIYPCRTGQSSCSAVLQNNKIKQSMIYIACVDKSTNGLGNIQTYSKVKNMGYVNSDKDENDTSLSFACPKNSSLIFGFSLEFHTNFSKTRNNFTGCSKASNTCHISGTRINTKLGFFKPDKYSLAIVAVCSTRRELSLRA